MKVRLALIAALVTFQATPVFAERSALELKLLIGMVAAEACPGIELNGEFKGGLLTFAYDSGMTADQAIEYLANKAVAAIVDMKKAGKMADFCRISREGMQ